MKTTVPMVEFFAHGIMVSETYTEEVDHRDPYQIELPKGTFGFCFFDKVIHILELDDGRKMEHVERINESGKYYPGGIVFNQQDIKKMRDMNRNYSALYDNMVGNKWPLVVKTILGNFQPFEGGDQVTCPANV